MDVYCSCEGACSCASTDKREVVNGILTTLIDDILEKSALPLTKEKKTEAIVKGDSEEHIGSWRHGSQLIESDETSNISVSDSMERAQKIIFGPAFVALPAAREYITAATTKRTTRGPASSKTSCALLTFH